jgi:hypothetical protein
MTLEELNLLLPDNKKKAACLNESAVASLLGCSPSTIANYRANAKGIAYIKVDNGKKSRILYPKDAIVEFLNNTIKTV